MASRMRHQTLFKAILIGDPAVGKTSIRLRYMGQGFKQTYLVTLGADFAIKRLDNHIIQIWDLAGQYHYKSIRRNYYTGAVGAILVFDKTRPETFDHMIHWIDELLNTNGKLMPMVIVGNKQDLCEGDKAKPCVDADRIEQVTSKLRETFGFRFPYFDASALSGLNVNDVFQNLIEEISSLS
ncbi:MAG: Rab family GTPase [Candidatus Kariarchaeaceae archaeon]